MIVWLAAEALAESWCAAPLVAHEWGVEVLRADGGQAVGVPMPSWFHRSGAAPTGRAPVRDLPADSGVRTLPVVQLYASRVFGPEVPFAFEVGFTHGDAAVWFPAVDRLLPSSAARSPAALDARSALVDARASRQPFRVEPPLPPDPTRQLAWDALVLVPDARPSHPAEVPWVEALRDVPGALWVTHGDETDRFLFYEATTRETPAVTITRGDTWSPARPHYVVRNDADWPVHDLVVIADGRAWAAPTVPPGASAGFLLDRPLDRDALRGWLRDRWVDPADRAPAADWSWTREDCVMGRDPALPVERAGGHRLYDAEVDVLLSVWTDRLLASDGVRVVYREDVAALDALVPASLYASMSHFVRWRRLGVVLVEGLALP